MVDAVLDTTTANRMKATAVRVSQQVRITPALPRGSNLRPWLLLDLPSLGSFKPIPTRSKLARQPADPATYGTQQECAGLVDAKNAVARHGQRYGWHRKNARLANGDVLTFAVFTWR